MLSVVLTASGEGPAQTEESVVKFTEVSKSYTAEYMYTKQVCSKPILTRHGIPDPLRLDA